MEAKCAAALCYFKTILMLQNNWTSPLLSTDIQVLHLKKQITGTNLLPPIWEPEHLMCTDAFVLSFAA